MAKTLSKAPDFNNKDLETHKCPHCGRYVSDVVKHVRRKHSRKTKRINDI